MWSGANEKQSSQPARVLWTVSITKYQQTDNRKGPVSWILHAFRTRSGINASRAKLSDKTKIKVSPKQAALYLTRVVDLSYLTYVILKAFPTISLRRLRCRIILMVFRYSPNSVEMQLYWKMEVIYLNTYKFQKIWVTKSVCLLSKAKAYDQQRDTNTNSIKV